jgi:hypothetical protein
MTDPATSSWPVPDPDEATPLFFAVIHPEKETTVPEQDNVEQAAEPRVDVWAGRHPGIVHFQEMFKFDHLGSGRLREVSARCAELAESMVADLPDGPELTAGLRSLWEAKNSFVVQAARFSGVDHGPNKA